MTVSIRLTHRFKGFTLDLGFEAAPGITVLFGPSGSGKSTLVDAVAGLLRPDEGRISLSGETLFDREAGLFVPPHRRRIGYVFQDARLFPHLSLKQNLFYGRWFNRRSRDLAPPGPLLELLGLTPLLSRRVADLSGGEAARVALGRALLSGPRLLLLDEPLAALDGARKSEVLPYLERLRDELGLPMLYVTHSREEARRLATTVVLMEGGRITGLGTPEQLLGAAGEQAHLSAQLVEIEPDGLWRCATAAGPVWVEGRGQLSLGSALKLSISAQDVLLSLHRPEGFSALNVLPAEVEEVMERQGSLLVRLRLSGGEALFARIPQRARGHLGLHPGQRLHAVVQALRLER